MVKYRCNIMDINSLETFVGVRGGFNSGVRDVYFVRILGASENIQNRILEIDKKMGIDMHSGKLDYYRISKLPKLASRENIDFYTKVYEKYLKDNTRLDLKIFSVSDSLKDVVCSALEHVIEVYKSAKKTVTESMLKNFTVKVMFWLDSIGNDILMHWDEKRCIKIIAENVTKEHEYLFYYFLTQVGCDVLLLEVEKDAEVADKLRILSRVVSEDVYCNLSLPEYMKYIPEPQQAYKKEKKQNSDVLYEGAIENRQVTVVIPERNRRKNNPSSAATTNALPQMQTTGNTVNRPVNKKNDERREKTFEELAQLASSIVMIAVHDDMGEVEGTGSGIMIGKDGYILTNCHVISGGRSFSVRIEDDENIYRTNEVIKYNSNLDLAVIRIRKTLRPLPIYNGKQKLVRGQKVVAIGSPLGLFNSVSDGIISGFRNIRDEDMIQFTAPISHGSSGGAVLNMYGEVIGISTAGIDAGQNINLAMGYESILTFAKGFY